MHICHSNGSKPDPTQLHRGLIDHLKKVGHLVSPQIEAAFRAVPRHLFLSHLPLEEVYRDQAITTKVLAGQFVSSSSQPSIMAIMFEQLQVQPGQRVLEIGAGPGYNAALLAHLVGPTGQVVTIDIDDDIVKQAQINLQQAGYGQVRVILADGALGYGDFAPYDRIILTVSAGDIAPAWLEQLASNGRLLLPLGLYGPQVSVAFDWEGDHLVSVSLRGCGFVSLRGSLSEKSRFIQLRPDLVLTYIRSEMPASLSGEAFFQLLQGPYQELALSAQTTPEELLFGFMLWLSLRHPAFYELFAYGEFAEKDFVPTLFQRTGKGKSRTTIGLFSEQGLCAFAWSDGFAFLPQAAPSRSLKIRWYGPVQQLAEELRNQFLVWQADGRPAEAALHISAYPLVSPYEPVVPATQGQVSILKQHTQFICTWREST